MIGSRAVLSFLSSSSTLWPDSVPITILNVGSNPALTVAINKWAASRRWDIRLSETNNLRDPKFLQAQQFDYVVGDGALRNQSEDEVQNVLVVSNRLAKRGLVFTDYLRDPRAAIWRMFGALITGASVLEAKDEVQGGFTIEEVRVAADKAGLKFATVRRHLGYIFSLSGERGLVMSTEMEAAPGLVGA